MANTNKKLYIKTYGCQMNVYDSHKMADLMAPLGYELADDYTGADMVVLNTCHIREKAAEKVYSELGRINKEKKKKPEMLITVGGCVGQAEGDEIKKRAPYVDFVVGPQSFQNLPRMIANQSKVELDFTPEDKFDKLPEESKAQGVSAFLTIQEGCDKFCTYCVVPYTRGAEYSRPYNQVLDEAKKLADQGTVDINLLGQNVNAYHSEGKTIADLIRDIAEIEGIERIKYTTSHPRDMQDDLIAAHGEIPELQPFLHLPVQAGSNNVLEGMNRQHSREFYYSLIERLRKSRPDIAMSSDFIVGFPGETEQDFQDTYDLVNDIGFTQCYSFKYSPRPGTPGALREDEFIPDDIASERLARLQSLISQQQLDFNKSCVGKTMQVLLDREGKLEGQFLGKTEYMQSVHLTTELEQFGNLVNVKITDGFQTSLSGKIISEGNIAA